MTPEAKQLLIDKPELCKEIADLLIKKWYSTSGSFDEVWEMFLKEHTKPDWEILSFRDLEANHIIRLNEYGDYDNLSDYGYEYEWGLDFALAEVNKRLASIHSVRRLDGEVFEVGNRTNNGTIERFETSGDSMRVFFKTKGNYHVNIDTLTKLKPLFKTEDGIDVYEGDRTWAVRTGDMFMDYNSHKYTGKGSEYLKYFSTREAAEAWVQNQRRNQKQNHAWQRLRKLI